MGCPANLEKDRDQENKNQHHDRRNDVTLVVNSVASVGFMIISSYLDFSSSRNIFRRFAGLSSFFSPRAKISFAFWRASER